MVIMLTHYEYMVWNVPFKSIFRWKTGLSPRPLPVFCLIHNQSYFMSITKAFYQKVRKGTRSVCFLCPNPALDKHKPIPGQGFSVLCFRPWERSPWRCGLSVSFQLKKRRVWNSQKKNWMYQSSAIPVLTHRDRYSSTDSSWQSDSETRHKCTDGTQLLYYFGPIISTDHRHVTLL